MLNFQILSLSLRALSISLTHVFVNQVHQGSDAINLLWDESVVIYPPLNISNFCKHFGLLGWFGHSRQLTNHLHHANDVSVSIFEFHGRFLLHVLLYSRLNEVFIWCKHNALVVSSWTLTSAHHLCKCLSIRSPRVWAVNQNSTINWTLDVGTNPVVIVQKDYSSLLLRKVISSELEIISLIDGKHIWSDTLLHLLNKFKILVEPEYNQW